MTDNDAALVARIIVNDDRVAFEQLLHRHQSPVRNFLRRLTRNDVARADDLAQETFLRLFRSIKTFRGQAKFSSWLYRIAYNTFLDDQRAQVIEVSLDDSRDSLFELSAERVSDEIDMERALQYLSDRQRAVFDLHYHKGMSHQEIAVALQMPLGTIKSDLTRGLDQLRKILANTESHEYREPLI